MNMKRIIISLAIIGVFVLYSLGIRHKAPVLNKPSSLATTTPPSTGSTGSSSSSPTTTTNSSSSTSQYKDGTYTGSTADAFYGNVQVAATITGGKITDVKFLQYPNSHSTSVDINQQAMPYLKQETIQAQNANVQIISGATFTSQAFIQSLGNALQQAMA